MPGYTDVQQWIHQRKGWSGYAKYFDNIDGTTLNATSDAEVIRPLIEKLPAKDVGVVCDILLEWRAGT